MIIFTYNINTMGILYATLGSLSMIIIYIILDITIGDKN